MIPRKARTLLPSVAEDLEMDLQMVVDATTFYWREVRKSLSAMKYPRIHIVNLGDFTVKHWNIDDKIEMLEKWGNKDFPGIQQMKAKWNTDELMFSLKNMKDMLAVEQQRKEFINLHKKTKHGKHKDIYDLEREGKDT